MPKMHSLRICTNAPGCRGPGKGKGPGVPGPFRRVKQVWTLGMYLLVPFSSGLPHLSMEPAASKRRSIIAAGAAPPRRVALETVAPDLPQNLELLLRLHPFGHDGEPRPWARATMARTRGIVLGSSSTSFTNERSDLQAVDGEKTEVAERGVPVPKSVDCETYPECSQPLHLAHGLFRLSHDHVLGQIQLEQGRIQAALG